MRGLIAAMFALSLASAALAAAFTVTQKDWGDPARMNRQAVIEKTMTPYDGPSVKGVDPSTLTGKIMCGYQGWHAAEGDGAGRGWYHWSGRQGFKPGSTNVDLWPDVSELAPDERYATAFKLADGKAAEVYSAFNAKTVVRHFEWMKTYGIDGVFVQRFVGEVAGDRNLRHFNVVLQNCRLGANLNGRTYAVMYDLSGLGANQMSRVMDDWKLLVDRMQVTRDKAYQRHKGKPVVAVWGFGFNDGRRYTPTEGLELLKFLHDDPKYGGNAVMLGVPSYWRTQDHDSVKDPALVELIAQADIVSGWMVGRYSNPAGARDYATRTLAGDIEWCKQHKNEYMPVVFPGFTWHNMNPSSKSNQIPRLGGEFLWSQYAADKKAGATMMYQAMFDEVDEGTAIYKVTNNPPVGDSVFVTYEGLPSDHYLRLVGLAGRMLRGEIPLTDKLPNLYPK